jgi:broad specificity phosphatase PhoE
VQWFTFAAGEEQALAAGRDIAANITKQACALWSSPLTRCIQTAANVMASVSVPPGHVSVHDNLLEMMSRGHVCNERATRDEIASAWPQFNSAALPDSGPVWSSAEPPSSVKTRMQMMVQYLQHKYASARLPVIVVSHHDALFELTGKSLSNGQHYVIDDERVAAADHIVKWYSSFTAPEIAAVWGDDRPHRLRKSCTECKKLASSCCICSTARGLCIDCFPAHVSKVARFSAGEHL